MSGVLWDWAVGVWAAPGVADDALHLQDAHDQNVVLLLWAAWCAVSGRNADEDVLEAACDTARVWSETAIIPLRTLRRDLKTRRPDMDDADREALRAKVQAIELDAERRLMTALAALAPAPDGPARSVHEALIAVSRVWGEAVPRPALGDLAARLSG